MYTHLVFERSVQHALFAHILHNVVMEILVVKRMVLRQYLTSLHSHTSALCLEHEGIGQTAVFALASSRECRGY